MYDIRRDVTTGSMLRQWQRRQQAAQSDVNAQQDGGGSGRWMATKDPLLHAPPFGCPQRECAPVPLLAPSTLRSHPCPRCDAQAAVELQFSVSFLSLGRYRERVHSVNRLPQLLVERSELLHAHREADLACERRRCGSIKQTVNLQARH